MHSHFPITSSDNCTSMVFVPRVKAKKGLRHEIRVDWRPNLELLQLIGRCLFKILFFWSIGSFLFPNLFPGKLFSDQEPFFSGLDLNLAFTFFNMDSTLEARQGL